MYKTNLIINADDFGYNQNVNSAIVHCFQKNLINSTTIMANMEGFEEAVKLARQHEFTNKIGLHIHLTEGKPITDLSGTGLIDNNGEFIRKAFSNPNLLFSTSLRNRIKNEIKQQYNKLLSANIVPTHVDSHHHVHTIPWISSIFIEFAKEENKKIRIANDRFRKNLPLLTCYKLLNIHYKKSHLNFSDKFESVKTFVKYYDKLKDNDILYEIMVHPIFKNKILMDAVDNIEFEELILKIKQSVS